MWFIGVRDLSICVSWEACMIKAFNCTLSYFVRGPKRISINDKVAKIIPKSNSCNVKVIIKLKYLLLLRYYVF